MWLSYNRLFSEWVLFTPALRGEIKHSRCLYPWSTTLYHECLTQVCRRKVCFALWQHLGRSDQHAERWITSFLDGGTAPLQATGHLLCTSSDINMTPWSPNQKENNSGVGGGAGKWPAYALVSELDWLTEWLAHQVISSPTNQLNFRPRERTRSGPQKERTGRRQGKGKEDGLLQFSRLLAQLRHPTERQEDTWLGQPHPLHWLRLQAILSEGVLFLPWPRLPSTSAGATTPALLPCSPWGKPPLEMVLQCGLCLVSAVRPASSKGPRWKCRWFRASAAHKRQGLKQGWCSCWKLWSMLVQHGWTLLGLGAHQHTWIHHPTTPRWGKEINLPFAPSQRVCIQLYQRITSSHLAEGREPKGAMSELEDGSCCFP